MKQIYLKFSMLILCLVAGLSSAWAQTTVTFTFKTDADITYTATGKSGGGASCSVTKSNVTLEGSDAYTNTKKSLTCYKKSTLTITAPGNITKIDLAYNGTVYPFDEAPGSEGEKGSKFEESGEHDATYTPATPATSITLNNSNGGKTDLLSIAVTYTGGTIVNVTGVTLDQTSATIIAGDKLTLTATVAPSDATTKSVSWSSDNEEVAIVKDGVVTTLKQGTANITVKTTDGNKTATCAVTVNPKEAPAGSVFFETFDQFAGKGGNDGVWSGIEETPELGTFDNVGWTDEGYVLSGYQCVSMRKVDKETPSGLTSPTIGIAGNGKVTFKAQSWGTDGSNFYVDIIDGGTFVAADGISLTNNNTTAKVTLTKNSEWVDYTLNFNGFTENSKLRFYAPANKRAFLDEVAVFVTPAEKIATVTVSDAGYATYYNSASAYIMPEGMKGKTVTVENGSLTLTDSYKAGSVVPAGEPLVLAAKAGSYDLYSASTNETASSSNDLAGTDEETALAADANSCFYALTLDKNGANPGFYWMADDGAAFTNGAHKAYLKVAKAAGAKAIGYAFNEDATAIKSVATTTATDGKIYDMTGREVKAPKAGLYIVNGVKKYIK